MSLNRPRYSSPEDAGHCTATRVIMNDEWTSDLALDYLATREALGLVEVSAFDRGFLGAVRYLAGQPSPLGS